MALHSCYKPTFDSGSNITEKTRLGAPLRNLALLLPLSFREEPFSDSRYIFVRMTPGKLGGWRGRAAREVSEGSLRRSSPAWKFVYFGPRRHRGEPGN